MTVLHNVIDRSNAKHMSEEAHHLLTGKKRTVSRALHRFLRTAFGQILMGHQGKTPDFTTTFVQVFANDEAFEPESLDQIHRYAQRQHDAQAPHLVALGFTQTTWFDRVHGTVANVCTVPYSINHASLQQLQYATKAVEILADHLVNYARWPDKEAGYHDYQYRNLPCNIQPNEKLWTVSGSDLRNKGGGVLEWCYDQKDADAILAKMRQFPRRFVDVHASPYIPVDKKSVVLHSKSVASEVLTHSIRGTARCPRCCTDLNKSVFVDGESEDCTHCGEALWFELRDNQVVTHAVDSRIGKDGGFSFGDLPKRRMPEKGRTVVQSQKPSALK